MLQCEGYKMFFGTAKVTPLNLMFAPIELTGTWLYRPDTECWYCDGSSFWKEIVSEIREVENV